MENYGVELGEEKALIAYILNNLSEENKNGVTEEIVVFILDAMLDYYAESGVLDDSNGDTGDLAEEEVEINEFEMASFIAEKLAQEEILLSQSQLEEILDLEFEYNQQDGVYE